MKSSMNGSETDLDFVLRVHSAGEELACLNPEAYFLFETFDFWLAWAMNRCL